MVREKKQRVMAKAWLGVLAGEIKMTMYQELMVFSCDLTNMNFVVGYACYDSYITVMYAHCRAYEVLGL